MKTVIQKLININKMSTYIQLTIPLISPGFQLVKFSGCSIYVQVMRIFEHEYIHPSK